MTIKFDNMSDFLKASPFDDAFDMYPHTLTADEFYEHLHVKNDHSEKLLKDFHDEMFNAVHPDRVVFLKGFAGNGKTTFLHTFMREHPAYRHFYCDFQDLRTTDVAAAHDQESGQDEIKLLMNRYLRRLPGIDATFRFIDTNRSALKDEDFISFNLYEHLSARPPASQDDPTYIRRWMDRFDYKDIFTSLFVHLFRESKGERTIVYFDNLDVPRMEYLADRFLVYFQDAVANALQVSRHPLFAEAQIDFLSHYRFVFSLRDANEAILNAHLGDRIGFARAQFSVSFDAKLFSDITAKRIDYLAKHLPDHDATAHDGTWSAIFKEILHDSYFQNVFLPLYNYNYRELAGTLVEVIHDSAIGEQDAVSPFQMRGLLMFAIINRLMKRDFLQEPLKRRNDPRNGYCYIDRVMLTVLINSTNYRRRVAGNESDDGDPYGLLFFVKDLQTLYEPREILASIARCFLSHRSSRIHLLTVLNSKFDAPEEFVREHLNYVEKAERNDDDATTIKIRNYARSVELKVNPAGFTCVRYVLPHFEFYSNMVGNSESLFRNPLAFVNSRYAFEQKIDSVFSLVQDHISNMKVFFDNKYPTLKNMSAETFPYSKYCFRHEGPARIAKNSGHSHTIKIITTHRDYIDRFRLHVINRFDLDDPIRRRINELLIQRIKRYVKLLDLAPDRAEANSFAEQFNERIRIIERSEYADTTTTTVLAGLPELTFP